jgi:disulfide bond formation protein DsbB
MSKRNSAVFILNALMVIVLAAVLTGGYIVQFVRNEEPCPLCMLQRLAMIGIACGALFNLRFGIKPLHYGISLLSMLFGTAVSLRQIALHICPEFPTFGEPVLGLDLYAWAFLVFKCSTLAIAIMLILYDKKSDTDKIPKVGVLGTIAFVFIFLICMANVFTTFSKCGWGPCQG